MLTPDAQLCVTYLPLPYGAELLAHILTLTLALARCIVDEIGIRQHIVQSHFRMYFTHSILSNSAPYTRKHGYCRERKAGTTIIPGNQAPLACN